jgi:thiol:disulfide interchange protein DsbD
MQRFTFPLVTVFLLAAAAPGADGLGGLELPGPDGFGPGPAPLGPQALTVKAVPSHDAVAPGQAFQVALVVEVTEGWAWYSPQPGPDAQPAEIRVEPAALRAGPTHWPDDAPYQTEGLDTINRAFQGQATVVVPLQVPDSAQPGTTLSASFHLGRQVCRKGACVNLEGGDAVWAQVEIPVAQASSPNPAFLKLELPPAPPEPEPQPRDRQAGGGIRLDQAVVSGQGEQGGTGWFLFLAVLAGLSLNIMPCVLPIIPMRIYSIVNLADENRRRIITLGLAFAAGIVLFFASLAVVNIVVTLVRGQAYTWSEMWQLRWVRVGMIGLLVVVAANMFGLFTVSVPRKINQLEASGSLSAGAGHASSVGMGLMMAILSTPCSFGLLLLVLGWAQIQPLWLGTVAFVLMGAGMAIPHALLVAFPGLIQKLPKPGVWMEWFKQSMGFVLLLVVAWLLDTMAPDGSPVPWLVGFGVVLTAGLWMWGQWVKYTDPLGKKVIIRGIAAVMVVAAGAWMLHPDRLFPQTAASPVAASGPAGQPEAPSADGSAGPLPEADGLAHPLPGRPLEQIDAAWRSGRPVVVKFTAKWCLECKVVEARVYNDPDVRDRFRRLDAVVYKADVTDTGTRGSDFLKEAFPGKAPPLTVVFVPGDQRPHLLTGAFGKEELFEVLANAQTASR